MYRTEDKQSESFPPTAFTMTLPDHTCLRFSSRSTEMHDVETNQQVNSTYNNLQTPKVENKTINIDDYSMCVCVCGPWRGPAGRKGPKCLLRSFFCSSDDADSEASWIHKHSQLPVTAARVSRNFLSKTVRNLI